MTRRTVIIAACSTIVGLVIGLCAASWYWLTFNSRWMTNADFSRTQTDLIERVALLENLRAGHPQDATKLLEELVDGDLLAAASLARAGYTFSANARQAAARELQARTQAGYAPVNPSVLSALEDAFRTFAVPSAKSPRR
jgi:hypothetical protein